MASSRSSVLFGFGIADPPQDSVAASESELNPVSGDIGFSNASLTASNPTFQSTTDDVSESQYRQSEEISVDDVAVFLEAVQNDPHITAEDDGIQDDAEPTAQLTVPGNVETETKQSDEVVEVDPSQGQRKKTQFVDLARSAKDQPKNQDSRVEGEKATDPLAGITIPHGAIDDDATEEHPGESAQIVFERIPGLKTIVAAAWSSDKPFSRVVVSDGAKIAVADKAASEIMWSVYDVPDCSEITSVTFSPVDSSRILCTSTKAVVVVSTLSTSMTKSFSNLSPDVTAPACWSTNGLLVAWGLANGDVEVADPFTGEIRQTFNNVHADKALRDAIAVSSVCFYSDRDGAPKIITGGINGSIKVCDIDDEVPKTVKRDRENNQAHKGAVESVHVSPDATQLLSTSSDGGVAVWDVCARMLVRDIPADFAVTFGRWSRDGKLLVLASQTGIHLVDPATGVELRQIFVISEADRSLRSTRAATWSETNKSIGLSKRSVVEVAASAFRSGISQNDITLNVQHAAGKWADKALPTSIMKVASLDASGRYVLSITEDGQLAVSRVSAFNDPILPLQIWQGGKKGQHHRTETASRCAATGVSAFASDRMGSITIKFENSQEKDFTILENAQITSIDFSLDGEYLAVSTSDRSLFVFDVPKGLVVQNIQTSLKEVPNFVRMSGKLICTCSLKSMELYQTTSGKLLCRIPSLYAEHITAMSLSVGTEAKQITQMVVTGSQFGSICVCDTVTGSIVCHFTKAQKSEVCWLEFSNDGKLVLATYMSLVVALFDSLTGEIRIVIPMYGVSAIFSENKEKIGHAVRRAQTITMLKKKNRPQVVPQARFDPRHKGRIQVYHDSKFRTVQGYLYAIEAGILPKVTLEALQAFDEDNPDPKRRYAVLSEVLQSHPYTVFWCPEYFEELAMNGKTEALLKSYFMQDPKSAFQVAVVPFGKLLQAAVESQRNPVETIEMILDRLVKAVKARNAVVNRESDHPGMQYSPTQSDAESDNQLIRKMLERIEREYPGILVFFFERCPLLKADPQVAFGINGRIYSKKIFNRLALVKPSSALFPAHFWETATKDANSKYGGKHGGVPCECCVLPFAGLTGPDSDILNLLLKSKSADAFGSLISHIIVKHKWSSYAKKRFYAAATYHAMQVILVMLLTAATSAKHENLSIALSSCLLLTSIFDAITEFKYISVEGWRHWRDPFTYITHGRIITTLLTFISNWLDHNRWQTPSFAVMALLTWSGALYYLRGVPGFGPVITMMIAISFDVVDIVIVFALAMLSISNMLFIYLADSEESEFDSVGGCLYTVFKVLMLGEVGEDVLATIPPGLRGEGSWLLVAVVVLMVFIGPVLLLNLIIARMSDSYERIQDRAEIEFRKLKALLIQRIDGFSKAPHLRKPKKFPTYVQVLVRVGWNIPKALRVEWAGVLNDVKQNQANLYQMQQMRLDRVEAKTDQRMERLEKTISDLDHKLELILRRTPEAIS